MSEPSAGPWFQILAWEYPEFAVKAQYGRQTGYRFETDQGFEGEPTDAEDAGTGIAADMNARQLRINSGGAGR
jgi:hypothetical protein